MILPALFRRTLIFIAFLFLVAFSLALVQKLTLGTLPPVATGIGALTAGIAIGVCAIAMITTDDYLTPRHTVLFFISTSFIALSLGIGLTAFFAVNEQYPTSVVQIFGLGSLAAAVGYSIFAWMRSREAHLLPTEYRPESNILKQTLLPISASVLALAVSSGSLILTVAAIELPTFSTTIAENTTGSEQPQEAAPDFRGLLPERAEDAFQRAKEALQEGRYRAAHSAFQRAANLRHPDANYELAMLYSDDGYLRDFEKVHEHFEMAIASGHAEAIYQVANARRHGRLNYEKDLFEARRLMEIAAEKDHVKAQSALAHMLTNGEGGPIDNSAALYWFKQAAQLGDKLAQNDIGIFYLQGKGVEADPATGIEWLTRAAEQGVAVAEYNLGQAFHSGQIVEKDYEKAHLYFQRLAEKNIPYGFQMLGLQYLHGQGSAKNETNAFNAFREGAARGDTVSQYYLGYCYLKGLGTKRDSSAALRALTAAAKKGHPEAQLLLGDIYREGEIILADPVEAMKWYNLSANNGSTEAASALEKLTANLSEEELDDVQRRIQLYYREADG